MEKPNYNKHKDNMPWYSVPVLMTILGGISIVLLFIVRIFSDTGIIFYTVIFAWTVILIFAGLEIGRLENLKKKIDQERKNLIEEIKKIKESK